MSHFSDSNKEPQAKPTSPCNNFCELDQEQICRGCGRTLDEIVNWGTASDEVKLTIIDDAKTRLKNSG